MKVEEVFGRKYVVGKDNVIMDDGTMINKKVFLKVVKDEAALLDTIELEKARPEYVAYCFTTLVNQGMLKRKRGYGDTAKKPDEKENRIWETTLPIRLICAGITVVCMTLSIWNSFNMLILYVVAPIAVAMSLTAVFLETVSLHILLETKSLVVKVTFGILFLMSISYIFLNTLQVFYDKSNEQQQLLQDINQERVATYNASDLSEYEDKKTRLEARAADIEKDLADLPADWASRKATLRSELRTIDDELNALVKPTMEKDEVVTKKQLLSGNLLMVYLMLPSGLSDIAPPVMFLLVFRKKEKDNER